MAEKFTSFSTDDRVLAERVRLIVSENAPGLLPKT
ncbi:hypothetical protein ABIB48_003123 [Arthrobacter sp. UYCu511]